MSYEWKWIITAALAVFVMILLEDDNKEPSEAYQVVGGLLVLSIPLTFVAWLWRF